MAININANMSLGAAEFLDAREGVETLDELLQLNTNIIPDGFEVYVRALDCKYKYNSTYAEAETGCWKQVKIDGADVPINGFVTLGIEEADGGLYVYHTEVADGEDNPYETMFELDEAAGNLYYVTEVA